MNNIFIGSNRECEPLGYVLKQIVVIQIIQVTVTNEY